MSCCFRYLLVVPVCVVALLVPGYAIAQLSLTYSGETPTSGLTSYAGSDASDALWDYVYELSDSDTKKGPFYWGIGAPLQPFAIYTPDEWTGVWDDNITRLEYDGTFRNTALENTAGVVWTWNGVRKIDTPLLGFFHIQCIKAPELGTWVASSKGTQYDGTGTEWSPSPEPASVVLTSLTLLGLGWWRRRRKAD